MNQSTLLPPRYSRRSRLRVKTGCLTCLDRHKKCDESRPCCQVCTRLGLRCIWRGASLASLPPDAQSSGRRLMPPRQRSWAPVATVRGCARVYAQHLSPSPTKVIAGHSGFRLTTEQSIFSYFISAYAPTLCDGRAHPFYQDSSHCVSLALQVPWLMDAMLALAEHHRALSQNESPASAVRYYGQAVRGLRESIASMTAPEDPTLCAAIFAGMFEERLCDSLRSSRVHFYSSFNFLRTLEPNFAASHGSKSRMAFLRMQADITIYHIATRAIFEPDTHKLLEFNCLEDLDAYVQNIHPGPQDVNPFPSSSFLGPIPALYMLVYRITLLARKTPLVATDMAEAQQYLQQINDIKAPLEATSSLHFSSEDVANPFLAEDCTPRLYILALEILLMKVMRPSIISSNLDVQHRVNEAYQLLLRQSFVYAQGPAMGKTMSYHLAEPLCWPMLVIGVAISRTEHRATFKKVLGDLWNVSFNGFVRKISMVLRKVWEVEDTSITSAQARVLSTVDNRIPGRKESFDGLDFPLGRNGILSHFKEGT